MQVIYSFFDFEVEHFLSLDFALHYKNLAPMGLKVSSFSICMFGTDADKPFAVTLRILCLDRYGL